MNKPTNAKQNTVCGTFRSTWFQIARMYNMQAEHYGGNITIAYYLLNVDSAQGSFATDIALRLDVEGTGLGRMTKKLEDEKLISRTIDKLDKRKVKITLTAKGKKAKEMAKDAVRSFNKEITKTVSDKELESFFATAQKIQQLAEQKINE